MSVELERRIFNIDEYHLMSRAGILSENDRVELIDGEIIRMSPIGSRHVATVNRLNAILNQKSGDRLIVSVQNPISLSDYSEPQPDIAVLKARADFYSGSLPTAEDVLLIIEVAETSMAYDRDVKLPLYARAGVPEVWLANLSADTVEAHAEPLNGVYQSVRPCRRGESLSPIMLTNMPIRVEEILG